MCWEEWGPAKAEKVVLLFPSFSVGSHAKSTAEDPTSGWYTNRRRMIPSLFFFFFFFFFFKRYEHFIGARKAIDTEVFRIICPANLGSPFGSTSPISLDPSTGRRFGKSFPQITPFDIARAAHALLFDHLGVQQLHAVLGGSLGGNLALQFAASYPDYVRSAIPMSCTGHTSPLSVGLRHVQRQAIISGRGLFLSPSFFEIVVFDKILIIETAIITSTTRFRTSIFLVLVLCVVRSDFCFARGLSTARQLAMLVYKSWDTFNTRFDWNSKPPYVLGGQSFEIESYLTHHGQKFANNASTSYDPNCYLLMSKASDLTNLQFRGEKVRLAKKKENCKTQFCSRSDTR